MSRQISETRRRGTRRVPLTVLALLWSACGAEPPPAEPSADPPAAAPAAPAASDAEEIPGRWREIHPQRLNAKLSEEQRDRIARLEAIGYLSGTEQAPALSGVTVHRPERTWEGLNFYTSGHAPEAILMDMDGEVLHRWRHELLEVWPDYPKQWLHTGAGFWRRAHLFENGDVLVIFEGMGIVKLDKDSKVVWASPVKAHHDLQVLPNGDVVVLTREGHLVPRVDPEQPILEDFISILDPGGQEKRRVSILEAFERSEFNDFWDPEQKRMGDLFHTNTVEVLDGRIAKAHPAFRRGNVLTSMLIPDTIAVVDMDQEKVVWARKGSFKKQHDPKILENGRMLVFDNRGNAGQSRVLEYEPGDLDAPVWEYRGTNQEPFASFNCGTAERLPNGNTLITESDGGRAFEITPEHEIVWEFYNPHRAGEEGELIATLFEMVRLPPDFPTGWAQGAD